MASTTSEVISTIGSSALPVNVISIAANALSGIVSPIDLNSTQNLKDVVGFDLHVNGIGEYVANDLSTALELNPSQLVADVSTSTGSAIEDLPRLELGAAETLNNLFGKGLLDVGHLRDLISGLAASSRHRALAATWVVLPSRASKRSLLLHCRLDPTASLMRTC